MRWKDIEYTEQRKPEETSDPKPRMLAEAPPPTSAEADTHPRRMLGPVPMSVHSSASCSALPQARWSPVRRHWRYNILTRQSLSQASRGCGGKSEGLVEACTGECRLGRGNDIIRPPRRSTLRRIRLGRLACLVLQKRAADSAGNSVHA